MRVAAIVTAGLVLACSSGDRSRPQPGSGSVCDRAELALDGYGRAWPLARRFAAIDRVPNGDRPLGPTVVIGDDHVAIDGKILAESRTITHDRIGGPAGETWGQVAPAIVTAAPEGAPIRFEVRR